MGISIWHLLIVVVFVFGPIAVGAIALKFNGNNTSLSRKAYVLRIIGLIFLDSIPYFFPVNIGSAGLAIALLIFVVSICLVVLWSASRLRDMGNSRKYQALWSLVPLVAIFYVLYLMFAKSKSFASETKVLQTV